MQLTTNVTVVDFFPEAYIADEGVKRFQKRVTWRSNGLKSYSTVTMLTAKNEWASRIANGAEVTDYHTDKMPRSEYAPMMCWEAPGSVSIPPLIHNDYWDLLSAPGTLSNQIPAGYDDGVSTGAHTTIFLPSQCWC